MAFSDCDRTKPLLSTRTVIAQILIEMSTAAFLFGWHHSPLNKFHDGRIKSEVQLSLPPIKKANFFEITTSAACRSPHSGLVAWHIDASWKSSAVVLPE